MKYYKSLPKSVYFILIIGILSSCKYYRAYSYNDLTDNRLKKTVRYMNNIPYEHFFLHSENEVWEINSYDYSGKLLYGTLVPVNDVHKSIYDDVPWEEMVKTNDFRKGRVHNYKGLTDWAQTHLYVDQIHRTDSNNFNFELADIKKIETLKYDRGRNSGPIIGATAGGLVGGLGTLLLIACNCPHAYTHDGESYHFTNTLYTGATAKNLERNDYKILPDYRPESDSYELIIKNEENESHFTNLLELIVVDHNVDVEVISDKNGIIHSISQLERAKSIVDEIGNDLTNKLSYRDDVAYSFDNPYDDNMVNAFAVFAKPQDVSNAKLVLKLKNSEWGGFVYKTFASMLGDKYDNWVEKNQTRTPEDAEKGMVEAGIPMLVSIKKGDEWVEVGSIDLVGEVSYNTLALPIDESLITGENIEIRLQAGFKFWELDYVGIDFSQDADIDVDKIKPTLAEGKSNYLAVLEQDDDLYMEHLFTGDSTRIKFEGLKTTGKKRTIILRSKGYYISNDEYTGTPYWKGLIKLRTQGGLSRLSKELYLEYSKYATLEESY